MHVRVWIILAVSFVLLGLKPIEPSKLVITFKNIRSTKGSIRLGLCSKKEQFPKKPAKEYIFSKAAIKGKVLVGKISTIEPGTYAIALLDDENDNDKMDYSWGIPQEGYGFSNDVKPKMLSSPDYEDCLFSVKKSGTTKITITMQYF